MGKRRYLVLAVFLVAVFLFTGCGGIVVEEFPICTNDAAQSNPVISGNIVVWWEQTQWHKGRNEGFESIYGYNLETRTEFLICMVEETQKISAMINSHDVSGNIVVWSQYTEDGYDIWGCDLETGEIFPVCTDEGSQTWARVSGNFILWQEKDDSDHDQTRVYDLTTKQVVFTLPCSSCSLSGDIIVWATGEGVFGYNLKSGVEFPISTSTIGYGGEVDIGGDTVVWVDHSPTSRLWREGRAGDIIAYDLESGEEFRLPETWTNISVPAVDGDFVIWTNDIYKERNIQGYDLRTRQGFTVCAGVDKPRSWADIDGNIVVWADRRNGNNDIYGARILRASE